MDHNTNPVKAIKEKCIDCSGGVWSYVKECNVESCALHPFRLGKNPYRQKREMTDEQRKAVAERFAKARNNNKE